MQLTYGRFALDFGRINNFITRHYMTTKKSAISSAEGKHLSHSLLIYLSQLAFQNFTDTSRPWLEGLGHSRAGNRITLMCAESWEVP